MTKGTTWLWAGRILTGLFALFMLGASIVPKLLHLPVAEDTLAELGWPAGYAFPIGLIELACLVLYLIPRTSVLGAILMMGLLGGAWQPRSGPGHPCSAMCCSVFIWACSCGWPVVTCSGPAQAVPVAEMDLN